MNEEEKKDEIKDQVILLVAKTLGQIEDEMRLKFGKNSKERDEFIAKTARVVYENIIATMKQMAHDYLDGLHSKIDVTF